MKLLARYLADYWQLVALALVLAAINQIFSLLDPLIFRYVIDEYATRFSEYTTGEFFRGVSLLLAAAVGVAFVSRVAKNFQDYFINVITQRLGARLYSDGIQHSLELPYSVFEDQRSGETLGKLQKVRVGCRAADLGVDQRPVHVARRDRLRDDLRLERPLADCADLLPDRAGARHPQLGAEQEDQDRPEDDRGRDHRARGSHDRVAAEHRARQEPGTGAAGDRPPQRHDGQDPAAGAEEGPLHPQPQLHPGHGRERAAHDDHVPDALPDLRAGHHGGAVLLALHLLLLHLRPAAGAGQHHQRLSRGRGVAEELPGHPRHEEGAAAAQPGAAAGASRPGVRARELPAPDARRRRPSPTSRSA